MLVNHQTEPVLFPNFDLDKYGYEKVKNLTNHSDFFFFSICCLSLVPDYSVPCSHLFNQIHVPRLPDISQFAQNNSLHLRVFSMLNEQHIPESVGDVSKMSAQLTILPRHSQRLSKCCSAMPGRGEHGKAEYLHFCHCKTTFQKCDNSC